MDSIEIYPDSNKYIRRKRANLEAALHTALKLFPISIRATEDTIFISVQDFVICAVQIEEETYRLFHLSPEWANSSVSPCVPCEDGTFLYYVDTMDEVVGELKRIVIFEAKKGSNSIPEKHASDLRRYVTREWFETTYNEFLNQADQNAVSKKANGSKKPKGIPAGDKDIDGASVSIHFGQGAPSSTPYISWWVVSVYYVIDSHKIVLGIEEDRYPHIRQLKPLLRIPLGSRKTNVAVFYETSRHNINYDELYEKFINVSEEVIRLGL